MSNPSTATGGVRLASRVPREEPDLWQEDDIPTDDRGSADDAGGGEGETALGGRLDETPERQNDSPRE